MQEFRRAREASQAAIKAVTSHTAGPSVVPGSGRYSARLADKFSVIVNGDYGADHSALSETHLLACAEAGVFVQVLPLGEPIVVSLALGSRPEESEVRYQAAKKARISVTMDTAVGPLRLRNVEFLVFEESMSEVLLSRPTLQAIGFDLDKHLATVRDVFHDADFSHIGLSGTGSASQDLLPVHPSRLARVLLNRKADENAATGIVDEQFCSDDVNSSQEDEGLEKTSSTPSPLFYGDGEDDDPLRDDTGDFIGDEDPDETKRALEQRFNDAIDSGLPAEHHDELRSLLHDYSDIFRTKMGSDPPASVAPMTITLKPDAKPVRVRVRRYSPPQAVFLRFKTDELVRKGLVVRNNRSAWACAPLLVPKSGAEQFRFTVDMRPVNSQTVPHAWPMSDLESVATQLSKDKCYALLDLAHCYWQFATHPDSQECQSFITTDGVFTPTRVLHGQTNATAYVQSTIQELTVSLRDKLLQWLDDLLFHCPGTEELMASLREFFEICRRNGIKLHAAKCQFFLKTVNWCGRRISAEGIRLDPRRLDALVDMQPPQKGDELQQFLCAANWMRSVIPSFSSLVEPLQSALEEVYALANKRTKQAAAGVLISNTSWNTAHEKAFQDVKRAIQHAVTLSHPDPEKILCLFTDASDTHWSGVLTQIPACDQDEPFQEQHHEPLSFLSGSFKGSRARWSTPEKEAFAIVESVSRLDYILLRPEGFQLFTDHKNLIYIFNPTSVNGNLQKHIVNKVERWALTLASFRYTIVHIPGEENVWADLLSRWGSRQDDPACDIRIASLFSAPVAPELDPDFTWPSAADIKRSQADAKDKVTPLPSGLTEVDGILQNNAGATWIPHTDTALKLRLCIIGHCGRGGHRGATTTLENIKGHFVWKDMKTDIATFCNTCLHCNATSGGRRVPRPFAQTLHADKPNELLHFDYLYMGCSDTGEVYILILKDDASSFIWLEACKVADAETTVRVLMKWFSLFGVVPMWCSDRGSHFKNKVMSAINKALHAHHHFTTPYCPQSNGTVETVCKEVLRACRALLSEFRLKEREWPTVLPLVQSIVNHSKRPSLGNIAPVTAFCGLQPDNPLRTLIPPVTQAGPSLSFVKAQRLVHVHSLAAALDVLHKETATRRTRKREEAVARHNAQTHVIDVNFEIGDYVLVAQRLARNGHKLRVIWSGPRRISRIVSDLVYECEDLINGKHMAYHANRLKIYADLHLNVTEELLDTVEHNDPHLNTVQELLDLRFDPEREQYEVRVKWRGFDYEDPTWEPFNVMSEDIPDKLAAFLTKFHDQAMVRAAKDSVNV